MSAEKSDPDYCLFCKSPATEMLTYELKNFELFSAPGVPVEIEYSLCERCLAEKGSQARAEALLSAKAIFLSQSYAVRPDWEAVH